MNRAWSWISPSHAALLALTACGAEEIVAPRGSAGDGSTVAGKGGAGSSPDAGRAGSVAGRNGAAGSGAGASAMGGADRTPSPAGSGGSGAAGSGSGTMGLPSGTLAERIGTVEVAAPAAIKPGVRNWRVWTSQMLKVSPIFTVPLADCGTVIGFTSGTSMAPNARVVRLDATDTSLAALDLGAMLELRGLAAEPDGHFAALLWSGATDQIWVKPHSNGDVVWAWADAANSMTLKFARPRSGNSAQCTAS